MRNIYGAFNQFDNDRKAERTKLGMQRAASMGRFPFKAPLGYLNVSSQNGPNLIPDAERAPLIRKAFELYGTGTEAKAKVLRMITSLGLKTQRGSGFSSLMEWRIERTDLEPLQPIAFLASYVAFRKKKQLWRPRRDLNPCYRRERAMS